jgi:hypothetical protein
MYYSTTYETDKTLKEPRTSNLQQQRSSPESNGESVGFGLKRKGGSSERRKHCDEPHGFITMFIRSQRHAHCVAMSHRKEEKGAEEQGGWGTRKEQPW